MNLKCLICSDLFLPLAEIYVTSCGHLFHYNCLLQWIERSKTCPQCRSKNTEKSIHRVYLSVEENVDETDANVLLHKLDNLQFQIKLKDMDIKNFTEKYESAKMQNTGLRDKIKEEENRVRVLESAMHALKEQVSYFKGKAKTNDKLEEELAKLREKLKNMESIQLVMSGSREQVNDMLRHNRDPHSLTIMVSTLKKELIDSDRRRKQLQSILKDAQHEAQNCKRELSSVQKEILGLRKKCDQYRNSETERIYLKQKLASLTAKHTNTAQDSTDDADTSTRRIIQESPAPLPKQLRILKGETIKSSSPSVLDTVQIINASDSPHLRVQSSTVGLSGLMNYNSDKFASQPTSTIVKPNKFSMFKQKSCVELVKKPPAESSYNGLGGHSKDEEFPTSTHMHPPAKRPRISVTSAKFRKLAPGSQKKLNDFY